MAAVGSESKHTAERVQSAQQCSAASDLTTFIDDCPRDCPHRGQPARICRIPRGNCQGENLNVLRKEGGSALGRIGGWRFAKPLYGQKGVIPGFESLPHRQLSCSSHRSFSSETLPSPKCLQNCGQRLIQQPNRVSSAAGLRCM